MKHPFLMTASALAAALALVPAHAQEAAAQPRSDGALEKIVVTGKRAERVSKGATGLPLDVKETPQTISTLSREDINSFALSDSNEALRLATGLNVEQYETNRAVFNSRGFEIQNTQIDGLGMTNDWGTVVGQLDTFLFDRIELIRGANGLLTGVGNASGTINYVRKRPTNQDGGEVQLTAGSYSRKRAALDYNKVFTADGAWAGRLVVTHEDKDSHLRDLHDKRTAVYGVVDGQIGSNGVLTAGVTLLDNQQDSPMWGSLTLRRADGSQAEFDDSSSTSQKWTYWNTKSQSAFLEYAHQIAQDWEGKLTYSYRHGEEDTRLLYAYSLTGVLNPDNTGLIGWPYAAFTETDNHVLDGNVTGKFSAFGRRHDVMIGLSQSRQKTSTDLTAPQTNSFLPLPAFPYGGDVYPEPTWGPRTFDRSGEQRLTRLYAATHLQLTDRLKGVLGVNLVKLEREGSSVYGNAATGNSYPETKKTSPYVGLTYDITADVLAYASYSDIFQNQDQTDIYGAYLAPMKGVNAEAGVKAEWLDKNLLTTFSVFTAKQEGLATLMGNVTQEQADALQLPPGRVGQSWYAPRDVKSKGFEFEATGRVTPNTKLTVGFTRLLLTGPDGNDIYEWVPRTTFNVRAETRLPMLPALRLGVNGRWQADVRKEGGPRQGAYLVANAFAAYELTDAATLRLNVNNLFDKKYIGGIAYGAIYGAPRNASVTLEYKL